MTSKINEILIVDDEDMIRELIVMELEDYGFSCSEAEDAEQALEILKNKNFDLVLTDAQMPKISGIEFIKILKSKEKLKEIPIVLMSGFTGATDIELSELNLASVIQKPFQVSEIIKVIDSLK